MLKMVDGTGIIGVDMICPLGVSTPQPPNYDRVEMEGTGILVLPNSLDAPLERLELGGKTEQVQTTGKNLFDTSFAKNKENYKEVTIAGSVIYAIELSLKPNTKYAFQCVIKSVPTTMNVGNSTIRYVVSDGQKRVITTNEDGKLYIGFSGNPDGEIHKIGVSIVDIQVEESTTVTPYEPYTGGKPSPNPEYPQEIKNVGKWNEGTQKYEIEISISGRNLFDFSTCEEGKVFEGSGNIVSATNGVLTDFIPCFPNSQYSRRHTGSTVVAFYDCDKNKIGFEIVGNTTFVTPEKCRYFRFSAVKTAVDYTKIVACPGQTVMDYEPYREPKFFTLTSDRPITKWDKLVEQGGQIGWLYGTRDVIFTGDESWRMRTETDMSVWFVRYNCLPGIKTHNVTQNIGAYSNYALWERELANNRDGKFCTHGNPSNNFLLFGMSKDYTVETFKTWLREKNKSGKPMCLTYPTESTEFIPLPQSEQNAIRALKTYYPTTVITVDGGEVDPDIKVTYRKEI